MKKYWVLSKMAFGLAVIWGSVGACDDAKYDVVNNKVYITQALSNESETVMVDSENGGSASFTVSVSDKMEQDVTIKLGTSQSVLDNYNRTHETDYKMLPSTGFSFSESEITISAGEVLSSMLEVNINPLTDEQSTSGDKYAIPVTVEPVSSAVSSVSSISSYILLLDQVIITSVPVLDSSNKVTPNPAMRQDYNLNEWSLEFRINMSSFDVNNQAIIGMYPDEIYVRFGDAGKDYNMLQIKTQSSQIDSNTRFDVNKWYHIAIVGEPSSLKLYVNGTLDCTLALSGSASWNIAKDNITLIGSGATYFWADCMLSEFRFWTKAISQSQIQNNMFAINPQTEGLEAYWKMNEGEGNEFEDFTGHGNNLKADGTVRWKDGIRSDEQ
ncbi:DUF1735 and LamG domain-containing protein [uncultured Bacteroides sp.]|jgi:Domain of unknown function (DUF1735).|uniref:DUF1735 and LamG domain-containing protein n=1 Tax=uncultured Bacteroides sp. TaxID=162156 RepID=UPI0026747970|nr:DUF1735 and LamG domain-containing protein [uncultured Bacteroides sp.]